MALKKGSKGDEVKTLQKLLGITIDGDFGAKTEEAVKLFLKSKGLLADGIVGGKTWEALGVKATNKSIDPCIVYSPLTKKLSKKSRTIKYIVIHYTAGASSASGRAQRTRDNWLNSDRQASADFVVDDTTILQSNPDLLNCYTWAVGDGNGKYGITNTNSVSIEICSNIKAGANVSKPNHEGWYFTETALNNAVKLTKILIKKFNIPLSNVVRHYDASRKCCPGLVGWNDESLYSIDGTKTGKKNNSSEWEKFKRRLV